MDVPIHGRQSTGLLQPSPRRAEECHSQTGNISLAAPSSDTYIHGHYAYSFCVKEGGWLSILGAEG